MGHMKDLDRRIRNGGDDAIAAVSEFMPRWIPVEERLPKDGEPVLVARRLRYFTDEMPTLISSMWYEHGDFCGEENDLPREGVTHWMPLPEPPTTASRPESTPGTS